MTERIKDPRDFIVKNIGLSNRGHLDAGHQLVSGITLARVRHLPRYIDHALLPITYTLCRTESQQYGVWIEHEVKLPMCGMCIIRARTNYSYKAPERRKYWQFNVEEPSTTTTEERMARMDDPLFAEDGSDVEGQGGPQGQEGQGGESRLDHPDQWRTKNDPPSEPQKQYVEGLAQQAGKDPKEEVAGIETKADASEKINELRKETGLDD